MYRKLAIFCAVALVVALAVPAQAAVQNVKVGGDITLRGFYRDTFDLRDDGTDNSGDTSSNNQVQGSGTESSENEEEFTRHVGIDIEADLTDNVSTQVRLVHEANAETTQVSSGDSLDIELDLANIQLAEVFDTSLSLTLGRQDLWFGNGFIVGSTLLADILVNAAGTAATSGQSDPNNTLRSDEYTDLTAFDAIRATLDLDPWTIDAIWAKVREGDKDVEDDIDLWGVNVGYDFANYNAEAEVYWFNKHDRGILDNDDDETDPAANVTHTIGIRGSGSLIDNLDVWGEVAHQFGDFSAPDSLSEASGEATTRDRDAWAADVGLDYTFVNATWQPNLGMEWIYYSGEAENSSQEISGDYEGWDPMFRGKFDTAIREFSGGDSGEPGGASFYNTLDPNDHASFTNQHQLAVFGGARPMDDLAVSGRYTYFWADEPYEDGSSVTRDDELGHEVDLQAIYDYTEDVQVSLLLAWFIPGDYFDGETTAADKSDDTAFEAVGTVRVVY